MTRLGACVSCAAALAASASALDNGRGITPPRGWRSWDAFENSVNQTLQMRQVDMLVDRSHSVDGTATSLLDLGYNRIGLDDAWQDCGKGVNHSFHDPSGKPLIRPDRFPDMAAMNAYAKSKGIGSGWYLNTCDCCEKGALQPMWSAAGDAKAVKDLGFDGLKLDSCGPSQELGEWARLLNATGNHVLVENCFDNSSYPRTKSGVDDGEEAVTEEDCPMNMFRSGGDMRADWPLMLRRLQTIVPWLGLSRPKCWAYLDMLEVGNPPGGTGESPLFENSHSWRAHFGAWLINSSPLILSFDLANATKLNLTWDFITNREALKINSDWAGSAGRLVTSIYDQSAPTPVFARPCSHTVDTQKFALSPTGQLKSMSKGDDRCISVPGCPPSPSPSPSASLGSVGGRRPHVSVVSGRERSAVGLGDGGIALAPCDGSPSQQWNFTGDPVVVTDVQTLVPGAGGKPGGCWEINGCGGSSIDTDYGCKKLPTGPRPWKGCNNMAWTFTKKGTVISGMEGSDGKDECLQVSSKDESTVVVGPCLGAPREQWKINGTEIQSAFGGCIDNHATKPANPQYGPLVVAPCGDSACGGKDHEWRWNSTTQQLVSVVPGMGEDICIESQGYGNHYATLNGVGCASPPAGVPRAQQFRIDGEKHRVSVDVRFNQTETGRDVGMLLCADIDFSAPQSGVAQPGARLIAQVFAKKVSGGAIAVLFLNADTNKTHDLSVDLADLGFGHDLGLDSTHAMATATSGGARGGTAGGLTVRDVWEKKDAGSIASASGNFTAHAIPPQDSKLVLFTPSAASPWQQQHQQQQQQQTTALAAGFSVSSAEK